ncbi:hypothetical protein GCK32_018607 [Trichostrongylus colubriformis]|uniref:TATA box-binding protein-associated factor RNA polymerase I subunit B n=1 Tax=Trichostrongylus colubriformis TaxID=6319 RepID=A0AAN8FVP0_TRICO
MALRLIPVSLLLLCFTYPFSSILQLGFIRYLFRGLNIMSTTCSICGSSQTRILDGLMYCATCGTQIFDFREVEADEEGLVIGSAKVRTQKSREVRDKSKASTSGPDLSTSSRKRRKGERLEGYRSSVHTSGRTSELQRDYTVKYREHAPAYLRSIGLRISTFTELLAKGAAMISHEKAVPSDFCVGYSPLFFAFTMFLNDATAHRFL